MSHKICIIVKVMLLITLIITTGVLLQYLYSILQQCILKQNCSYTLSPSLFLGNYTLSATNQIPEMISMFLNFLNSTIHLILYNLYYLQEPNRFRLRLITLSSIVTCNFNANFSGIEYYGLLYPKKKNQELGIHLLLYPYYLIKTCIIAH